MARKPNLIERVGMTLARNYVREALPDVTGMIDPDGVDLSETFSDLRQGGATGQLRCPRLQLLDLLGAQVADGLAAGGHAPGFGFDLQQFEQFVSSGATDAAGFDPIAEPDGIQLSDGMRGFHPGRCDCVRDGGALSRTMPFSPGRFRGWLPWP